MLSLRPKALRVCAWAGILLIGYLSLRAGGLGPRTAVPGHLEHALAYALVASITALAYPALHRAGLIIAFGAYGGMLEWGQTIVPGRDAKLIDAVGSTVGACIGVLGAIASVWFYRNWIARADPEEPPKLSR